MRHTHAELARIIGELIDDNGLVAVIQAATEDTLNKRDKYYAQFEREGAGFARDMNKQLHKDAEKLTACWTSLASNV